MVAPNLHTLFLQPVKPRWPCICICMYMVRVGVRVSIRVRVSVRVWVRFRVCHDMFRTRSSMFDRLQTPPRPVGLAGYSQAYPSQLVRYVSFMRHLTPNMRRKYAEIGYLLLPAPMFRNKSGLGLA